MDWMCETDLAGSRSEAVAIGQRLVEFGLVDHVNSVYRYGPAASVRFPSSLSISLFNVVPCPSRVVLPFTFARARLGVVRNSTRSKACWMQVGPGWLFQAVHVADCRRFKDDLLFLEFRDRTTPWPKALEMDLDSAKTIALRVNMEIPVRNGGPTI